MFPYTSKSLFLLLLLVILLLLQPGPSTSSRNTNNDITSILRSVNFLHEGTVGTGYDNLTYFTQCNGFSESGSLWTEWGPRLYLYNSSDNNKNVTAPAMGLRSSVPLGGLGSGSFELRATGIFADWMIENQGTALATDATRNSKIPFKDEAFMGIYVSSPTGLFTPIARTIRTNPDTLIPMDNLTSPLPGLQSSTYSGAFPFSRLSLDIDSSITPSILSNVSLYSYSPFRVYDPYASGIPAIAFSLTLTNPSTVDTVNVSFMLSLPLGLSRYTDRPLGTNPTDDPRNQIIRVLNSVAPGECLQACAEDSECTWWRHSGDGVPGQPNTTTDNVDCPGNDIYNPPRIATTTLQDCIDQCNTIPSCNGLIYDQIPGEQQGQCGNDPTSGKWCCLPKTECTSYSSKAGDTAWSRGTPTIPSNQCTLLRNSPAVEQYFYQPNNPPNSTRIFGGPLSGIKGYWQRNMDGNSLTYVRNNTYDNSTNATWQDPASAVADFTLFALDAIQGDSTIVSSVGSSNNLRELWNDFAMDGILQETNVTSVVPGAYGAVAASTLLAPGETRTVTLLFTWYLPHRLYVGQDLYNQYSTRYTDSIDVGQRVITNFTNVVQYAQEWNNIATNNSLPVWYQDYWVNSLAPQVKMGVWVAKDPNGNVLPNGRYRQFEAYSNCDLDPVHVTSYHAVPYATLFPLLAMNVLQTGWAVEQQADGMIREFLGDFSAPGGRLTGPMDISAGGRTMADTTSVFILYTLATFQQTGNLTFLQTMYPSLKSAAIWQINRTTSGINGSFPSYLQNTYDYLGLDQYPIQAYTGFLHIVMMRAIRKIAVILNDNSTLIADTVRSEEIVATTVNQTLWTETFWRAWQTTQMNAPNVTMSGTLHGQSWSIVLGFGLLSTADLLTSHLQSEIDQGCKYDPENCSLGILSLPGATFESSWAYDASPSQSMDNTITNVYLFGTSVLNNSPANKVIALYRDTLHDLWNWHDLHVGPNGLGCSQADLSGKILTGTPFVNAHYARQVQGYIIQIASIGQYYDKYTNVLRLSPPSGLQIGERLPFVIYGSSGILEWENNYYSNPPNFTRIIRLTITSGTLDVQLLVIEVNGNCDPDMSSRIEVRNIHLVKNDYRLFDALCTKIGENS